MCQVSFAEPSLFSRRRETKVASTGLSRERPGGDAAAGVASAFSVGGDCANSA